MGASVPAGSRRPPDIQPRDSKRTRLGVATGVFLQASSCTDRALRSSRSSPTDDGHCHLLDPHALSTTNDRRGRTPLPPPRTTIIARSCVAGWLARAPPRMRTGASRSPQLCKLGSPTGAPTAVKDGQSLSSTPFVIQVGRWPRGRAGREDPDDASVGTGFWTDEFLSRDAQPRARGARGAPGQLRADVLFQLEVLRPGHRVAPLRADRAAYGDFLLDTVKTGDYGLLFFCGEDEAELVWDLAKRAGAVRAVLRARPKWKHVAFNKPRGVSPRRSSSGTAGADDRPARIAG